MRMVLGTGVAMAISVGAMAAEPGSIGVGSRVRVTSPEVGTKPLVGIVQGLEPGALLIEPETDTTNRDSRTRISTAALSSLEVSMGRRSRAGFGALVGGAIGAAPGLLMTVGDYSSDVHGDDPNPAAVAALGAAGGALLGALLGWAIKTEDWRRTETPHVAVALGPRRGGGFAAGLQVVWGSSPRLEAARMYAGMIAKVEK